MSSVNQTVRWGVLGVAKIATEKVIPATQRGACCEVSAIASRDLDKARTAADSLGIARAYGSYDELLADPDVDAVYNPLPNHLHVEWSIRALQAGKHVLCEKPIGLTADEGQKLVDAGRQHPQLKLMEAFMYRHHPQWRRAVQIVRDGSIGELRTINSVFAYHNMDSNNIRNRADLGGGAMMDIGCYPVSVARFIFDSEPQRVLGIVERDPNFKTDRLVSALLDFGTGTATFTVSTQLMPYQRVNILGTTGRVEVEIPFNAPPDEPCRLWHVTNNSTVSGAVETITLDVVDQYTVQAELFARAVLDDGPVPTPIEDAVANMQVIEAVFDSAETGAWTSP